VAEQPGAADLGVRPFIYEPSAALMRHRNPKSPWNPGEPVEITPTEYEQQVLEWLAEASGDLPNAQLGHLVTLLGAAGEYEFDVVVRFSGFREAEFVVLIECKRYRNPVKREVVLSLHSKLRDVGAHKAMVVSTAGFQKGAIQYASAHRIAAVSFIDGRWTYETKSAQGPADPPPWVKLPRFTGHFIRAEGTSIHITLLQSGEVSALKDWLVSASSLAA
jgi:restriction system protein